MQERVLESVPLLKHSLWTGEGDGRGREGGAGGGRMRWEEEEGGADEGGGGGGGGQPSARRGLRPTSTTLTQLFARSRTRMCNCSPVRRSVHVDPPKGWKEALTAV